MKSKTTTNPKPEETQPSIADELRAEIADLNQRLDSVIQTTGQIVQILDMRLEALEKATLARLNALEGWRESISSTYAESQRAFAERLAMAADAPAPTLALGLLVTYTNGAGQAKPAFVTDIGEASVLSLAVFNHGALAFEHNIPFSAEPKPWTWSWRA